MSTLKTRADFLALRSAPSVRRKAFILAGGPSTRRKSGSGSLEFRVGFTVTKKMGNAVRRNRIRRRLRHAAEVAAESSAKSGFDYVIIGRAAALDQPFPDMVRDFASAFEDVNTGKSSPRRRRKSQS